MKFKTGYPSGQVPGLAVPGPSAVATILINYMYTYIYKYICVYIYIYIAIITYINRNYSAVASGGGQSPRRTQQHRCCWCPGPRKSRAAQHATSAPAELGGEVHDVSRKIEHARRSFCGHGSCASTEVVLCMYIYIYIYIICLIYIYIYIYIWCLLDRNCACRLPQLSGYSAEGGAVEGGCSVWG